MPQAHTQPSLAPQPRRGDVTREKLLDAAERWVAQAGFDAPTHRGIGERAHVHTALVNYHFGNMEALLEDMVERRAGRLIDAWRGALAAARGRVGRNASAVLEAYWSPFGTIEVEPEPWRRYLCVVAHLFHDCARDASRARYFSQVDADFQAALRATVPGLRDADAAAAYRYAHALLDEVLYYRCLDAGPGVPQGFHVDDVPRLIGFLSAGLVALAGPSTPTVIGLSLHGAAG
jgi:AcrR family transcriptional regulator